jgi:hypothetical protein
VFNSEAFSRRKLDETTFAEWLASAQFPYLLPDVWIHNGDVSPHHIAEGVRGPGSKRKVMQ